MTYLRYEMRLNPNVPEENELIQTLDQQGEIYGAKARFMRECMVRGYIALTRKMNTISQESDQFAVLDHLAQALIGGDYHVVKTYLEAKKRLEQEALEEGATGDVVKSPITPAFNSAPMREQVPSSSDLQVCPESEDINLAQKVDETSSEADTKNTSEIARTKPTVDWSRLRNLAGTSHEKDV